GGDVTVRQGPIDASGIDTGIGSDAGLFSITAGGNVTLGDDLSATGGAGTGSGCIECQIQGDGIVTVTAPIDVGGGRRFGLGGKITIAAGSDLTIRPGAVTADASAGGYVSLSAGERARTTRDLSGVLHVLTGTQVRTNAFPDDGFGGHVALEGCTVELEQTSGLHADGGPGGGSDGVGIVAHDRLVVG